jgi:hypothetical protein
VPGLNDIIQLLQGGALEPQQALEMHFANEEARKAKRQEALGGLMDTGFAAAQEGTSLESLIPMLSAQATFAGRPNIVNSPKLVGGLDALYNNQGQSLVGAAPATERPDPVLDPEDIHAIARDVRTWAGEGIPENEIRRRLHSTFANDPMLTYNNDVASDLDFTISRVLGG